jgi:hypothetical protein
MASETAIAAARLVAGGLIWTHDAENDYSAELDAAHLSDGAAPLVVRSCGELGESFRAGVGSVGHVAVGTSALLITTRSEVRVRRTKPHLAARLTTC